MPKEKGPKEDGLTIADIAPGDDFRVKKVVLAGQIGKRLVDMGFVAGTEGRLIRRALLGDPLQVRICHYDISLRKAEARGVEVEKIPLKD